MTPTPALGYNTSAFAGTPDIFAVADILAGIGYAGMELSLDRRHYHPLHTDIGTGKRLGEHLRSLDLDIVVGTGARYVLSGTRHEPSLVSDTAAGRALYLDFLRRSIRSAPTLGARVVMLHSGYLPRGSEPAHAWEVLVDGCAALVEEAADAGVVLGFEFHPDMFVRTLDDYRRLARDVGSDLLGLTLDAGHVRCTEERSIAEVIVDCGERITNVHLEDIRGREHVHLPLGDGDIDFSAVFSALRAVGYRGLVNAEFNTDDLDLDETTLARETYRRMAACVREDE